MTKFNVGDKVRVVHKLYGHDFSIGDIVTISSVNDFDYTCSGPNNKKWFLRDHELEPAKCKAELEGYTKVVVTEDTSGWPVGFIGWLKPGTINDVYNDDLSQGWFQRLGLSCEIYAEEEPLDTPSNVNSPSHYNESGIECIEAIRASLGDEFPAYCKGNVMKYLWRYKYKNGLEDLEKAQVYLGWMIDYIKEYEDD